MLEEVRRNLMARKRRKKRDSITLRRKKVMAMTNTEKKADMDSLSQMCYFLPGS